jgi:hypothetical protein
MNEDLAPLLHNMSAPPKSVVKYAGLSAAAKARDRMNSVPHDVFGTAVAFRLSANLGRVDAAALLDLIGEGRPKGGCENRLMQLIETRARELLIPDGAVVIPVAPDHRAPWPDALAAIAIITKSSDNIWLRGKFPRLSVLRDRREISLLIPPAFATKLEEMTR